MVDEIELENTLQTARMLCEQQAVKLTPKRLSVLKVLLLSNVPLSAYELAEQVTHFTQQVIKPMSIYRILAFLSEQHLVHRLNMNNKYVACNKISCCQEHGVSQFLICTQCESVQEVTMPKEIKESFMQQFLDAGCYLKTSHIELEVVCHQCRSTNQNKTDSNKIKPVDRESNYANSVC